MNVAQPTKHLNAEYQPRLLAIGSAMVDTVIDALPINAQELADLNGKFNLPIQKYPGGVAVNMAVCGNEVGFKSSAIIRIGARRESGNVVPDVAGDQILCFLRDHSVTPFVRFDHDNPTGEVILVYLSESYRMGIAEEGANARLGVDDCPFEQLNSAGPPQVLFIDGHMLDYREGPRLIEHLIRFAQSTAAVSVLDLLPHSLYKRMSFAQVEQIIAGVDVLQAQVNTLRRFRCASTSGRLTIEEFNEHLAFVTRAHSALILEDAGTVYAGTRSGRGKLIANDRSFSNVAVQRGFGARTAADWLFHQYQTIASSK